MRTYRASKPALEFRFNSNAGLELVIICIFLCTQVSFAEEQYIAESFGLCSKGVRYYEKGNLYEAKEILEKAIKLDPRNEEAQAYLELVNAELKMRAEGILDSYQKPDELVREQYGKR